MENSKIKWSCSLSNGETLYEEKGGFISTAGTLSPYRRLLKHIEKNGLTITSLSLYCDDGRRWNLPSAGNSPKFKAFLDAEKPIAYRFFRKIGADILSDRTEGVEEYAVIEAIYKDKKLQIWVNEKPPNASWSLII